MGWSWRVGTFFLACGVAAWISIIALFELDWTLRATDAGNLFVTLAVAFLIQGYLQRAYTESRAEKDLVIGQCSAALQVLSQVSAEFHASIDKPRVGAAQQILPSLRRLSNELLVLEEYLASCMLLDIDFAPVFNANMAYRAAVTDEGQAEGRIQRERSAIGALRTSLVRILVGVNRHP